MKNHLQGWYRLKPVYGGILLSFLLVILFRYYYLQMVTPPSTLLSIEQVAFTPSNIVSKNSPISSQQRILPDDWLNTPTNASEGWYRVNISFEQTPEGLWAIYLPVVQMSAAIYLNEVQVGQVGDSTQANRYDDPFVRADNQPYYFTLPANLLKEKDNALTLFVSAGSGSGLLGKIYLAQDKILRPVFA